MATSLSASAPVGASLSKNHITMLLKYSGISFISGAVNHGFFSGERSLWTALLGVVLFVIGATMAHRSASDDERSTTGLGATLLQGAVLSIGLGFFTGGLQHFPDSPDRSAWVVPLGFALSALALMWGAGWLQQTRAWWHLGVGTALTALAAALAAQWFIANPEAVHGFGHGAHDHGAAAASATTTPASAPATPASASPAPADAHAGHAMPAAATGAAATASTQAFERVNAKMHKDMAIAFTGDADRDFLAGMIPHHQGAIDMAEVVLAHGKDPKVQGLAKAIITAQKAEIKDMQHWLADMTQPHGAAGHKH